MLHRGLPAFGVLMAVAVAALAESRPAASSQPASRPAPGEAVLRMAVSEDGLTFTDRGIVFQEAAAAPALVGWPDGQLSLICDRRTAEGLFLMVASRSTDGGEHWSRPELVRMEGSRSVPGRHGALVSMPDGKARLYYVAGGGKTKKGAGRRAAATQPFDATMVLSAVTRDGLNYTPDRVMGLAFGTHLDLHVAAWQSAGWTHLFVDVLSSEDDGKPVRWPGVLHLVSGDEQHFEQAGPVPLEKGQSIGSVIAANGRARAYVSTPDGVRSIASGDGLHWKAEDGLRVPGGADPAVVRLKDGKYLMVYRAIDRPPRGGLAEQTGQPPAERGLGAMGESPAQAEAPQVVAAAGGEQSIQEAGLDTGPLTEGSQAEGASAPNGSADWDGAESPPTPDFVTAVNYTEWLRRNLVTDVENNALDAYDAFMPHQRDLSEERPDFPGEINDMFNSAYEGPIIPWDPAAYPEWEATHHSIQGLLEQFRQATRYEQYACPLMDPGTNDSPDGVLPVSSLTLPSLAVHRAMVKATLADAWRLENGRVDPARMVDAFETCLRNGDHMEQGNTLIHHLVGFAAQAMVERNALKALQHNVFETPGQVEAALNTLRQYDRYDASSTRWLPLEQAAALDMVQYLYPPGGEGQPRLDRDRAAYAIRTYDSHPSDMSSEEVEAHVQEKVAALEKLSPEQVRQSVEIIDSHFRELREKWRMGYPQVRLQDVAELEAGHGSTNMLTGLAIPGVFNAYHCVGRNEAGRRATQLTYEVHLFKARNGRWPASLDELPLQYGETSRIDPFTGESFGYQLTESGPTIYSAGEDGQDNGGVHADDLKREGTDHVFWPPRK